MRPPASGRCLIHAGSQVLVGLPGYALRVGCKAAAGEADGAPLRCKVNGAEHERFTLYGRVAAHGYRAVCPQKCQEGALTAGLGGGVFIVDGREKLLHGGVIRAGFHDDGPLPEGGHKGVLG